jgi:hypothetical protein
MDKSVKYVSGNFIGNFFTHQKSPLSIGEKIPDGELHHVHLFKGDLTEATSIDSFTPEEHLNREGMLLHNVTNVQIHLLGEVNQDKKIYDFDQLVLKNVKVESSWEQNGKTYGILKGELVGKIKKISSVSVSDNDDGVIPPPPIGGNTVIPIPPIISDDSRWNKYIPPVITDSSKNGGCLSSIWDILKWLLLIFLILFLLKQCNSCIKKDENIEPVNDCCMTADSLKILNDSLQNELVKLEEDRLVIDSLQNEIEKRRKREGGKTGEITVSLIWNTIDDLDLAIQDPNGDWLYYSKKMNENTLGFLDIDANVNEIMEFPIENIYINKPLLGRYRVCVNWFNNRTKSLEIPYYIQIKIGDDFFDFDQVIYDETNEGKERKWQTIYEFNYPNN